MKKVILLLTVSILLLTGCASQASDALAVTAEPRPEAIALPVAPTQAPNLDELGNTIKLEIGTDQDPCRKEILGEGDSREYSKTFSSYWLEEENGENTHVLFYYLHFWVGEEGNAETETCYGKLQVQLKKNRSTGWDITHSWGNAQIISEKEYFEE